MSIWISDEKLLIFASLISPSKMILFEKKYQTFDTVFHHQMKHLEVRQKYSAARRIFNSFSVFHLVMKHCVSCLIYYMFNSLRLVRLLKSSTFGLGLRFNDATATRSSLKKRICVLSVFIAIIPTYLFLNVGETS